jgi:CRP-like cAMP-binding protein
VRYLVCIWQLLLLTSKAYNVSLRLSPWGLHLYVGDEANDLFENRLYTSMFHVSQIFVSWLVVLIASSFVKVDLIEPLIIVGALMMFWELNPFIHSEGRKLIRALLLPSDRDAVSWHFEGNALINSINPEAVRQDRDFARICAIWGGVWLTVALAGLHQLAISFGPVVFRHLMHFSQASLISAFGLLAWLAGLYYIVQSFVETILAALVRPYWGAVKARFRRMSIVPNSDWPLASVVKSIESLPLFSHFHEQYLEKIADQSEVLRYPARTTILQQGKAARELFVLLEGEVEVMRRGPLGDVVWVTKLAPVSVFGEAALVDDTPRAAQVITKTAATVLRVPVSVLRQAALEAQSVRQLEVFRNAILVNQFFTSSPVFRSLSSSSIDFLCSRGTLEYFDQNQKVFEQGDAGDSLYLILRGTVQVEIHGTAIKHLNQGSFFGEIALIADIPRTATIVTLEPCAFFKISADSFWEILVQHMDLGVFIESISEARLREDLALAAPPPATGTDS